MKLTVIIPCYNERETVGPTITAVLSAFAGEREMEVLVVNDGSTDGSADVVRLAGKEDPRIRLLEHDRNRGYGAALKTGVQQAAGDLIAIIDADGTYPADCLPEWYRQMMAANSDMIVGARRPNGVLERPVRRIVLGFLKRYARWVTGRDIPDLNSGLRMFRRQALIQYIRLCPNGFSFTTTVTVSMVADDRLVIFHPVSYAGRSAGSKIRPLRDALSFIKLITRLGMYFAPWRILMPVAAVALLAFILSLSYDLLVVHNLGDKSILFFTLFVNVFFFALIADMVNRRAG